MKASTKNQAEGAFHQVKGKIKEVVGELSADPVLQQEGSNEKIAGKVQSKVGQINKVFGK